MKIKQTKTENWLISSYFKGGNQQQQQKKRINEIAKECLNKKFTQGTNGKKWI